MYSYSKKLESQDRNFEPECCVIFKIGVFLACTLIIVVRKAFYLFIFLNARLVISLWPAAFIHILAKIMNHLLSELYGASVFSTFDALNLKLLFIE